MTIDLDAATATELEQALQDLAHSWCGDDQLAQSKDERLKAAKILNALECRFGIRKRIERALGVIGFYFPVDAPAPTIH